MKKIIKLFDPVINSSEKNAITKVLESKFWASGAGSGQVSKFENEFKKYTQAKTCVAVNSGTAALNLACSLFNIRDKEVILPSLSFVSTAHCIVENGGIPVFVDIEPKTLCIDPKKIKQAITKVTTAIIPVHFGGMPYNIDEIRKIAKSFNLDIIEDGDVTVADRTIWNALGRLDIGDYIASLILNGCVHIDDEVSGEYHPEDQLFIGFGKCFEVAPRSPYTWSDVAFIQDIVDGVGTGSRRARQDSLNKILDDEDKKKRIIHLICRVKGKKVFDEDVEVKDVQVNIKDVDMITERVLGKVTMETEDVL